MQRSALLVIVVAMLSSAAVGNTAAQDTPSPNLPTTPVPSECTVEPRPASFFVAVAEQVLTTSTKGTPIALATPTSLDPMEGKRADTETVGALIATMRQAVACTNAGDPGRSAALYTDEYAQDLTAKAIAAGVDAARRLLGEDAFRAAAEADLAERLAGLVDTTPVPLPTRERATLVDVRDVNVLPDDRVVAVVAGATPRRGETAATVVFVEEGGRFLIASMSSPDADTAPTIGTPPF